MSEVSIVLLTGPSCAGKSHIQAELVKDVPCLDNDVEVMKRIFDLLPKEADKKLHEHIGNEAMWRHITEYVDFNRLVRLLHRDWFFRERSPGRFVGIGWMYSRGEHRVHLQAAFQHIGVSTNIAIARLMPIEEDFVARYCERLDKVNVPVWQEVTASGQAARREWALNQLEHYKTEDWQAPSDSTSVVDVQSSSDVLALFRSNTV